MRNIINFVKNIFNFILYIFTLPAFLIYNFFRWLLSIEVGGLFAIGTLIWCLYSGWKDINVNGAGLSWTFFKYAMFFVFFVGIFCYAINATCLFLVEVFEPGARINKQINIKLFQNSVFTDANTLSKEDLIREAKMQEEKAEKQREYEAKNRAYEEYKRIMREQQQREQREREQQRAYQQRTSSVDQAYQSAMSMFMLNEGYTLEELKKQRNRLLKSFHPDEGNDNDSSYAQKINVAFDLLKSRIV